VARGGVERVAGSDDILATVIVAKGHLPLEHLAPSRERSSTGPWSWTLSADALDIFGMADPLPGLEGAEPISVA